MDAQIFMMLITVVLVIRFIKGYATRKREFNLNNEVKGIFAHSFLTFGAYGIIYLITNIF